jgi:hypothetical protein
MEFAYEIFDEKTIRDCPTTEIAIRVREWPAERFRLWLPEWVGELWQQWDAPVAHQNFVATEKGGLLWIFTGNPKAHIEAELIPRDAALVLEVRVRNLAQECLEHVRAQNCLHLSEAPDFACTGMDDFSRIHIRTKGTWHSLAELGVMDRWPFFYREGFLESGRRDSWNSMFTQHNQSIRADHPLILCTARNSARCIGVAAERFNCVFHNQEAEYLRCIHSEPEPLPLLAPGKEATFRQTIYFVEGSVEDGIRACEQDGILNPPRQPPAVHPE